MPVNLAAGWDIIVQFAMNSCLIPEAHSSLQECLGDQYVASEWDGPLDSALGAEGDPDAALAAVNAWHNNGLLTVPLISVRWPQPPMITVKMRVIKLRVSS